MNKYDKLECIQCGAQKELNKFDKNDTYARGYDFNCILCKQLTAKLFRKESKKTCRECLKVKPLTEYYKQPGNKDNHHNDCKPCYKEKYKIKNSKRSESKYYTVYVLDIAEQFYIGQTSYNFDWYLKHETTPSKITYTNKSMTKYMKKYNLTRKNVRVVQKHHYLKADYELKDILKYENDKIDAYRENYGASVLNVLRNRIEED